MSNMGSQNGFIVAAAASVVHSLSVVPFIRWAYSLRKRSRGRYWSYLQKAREYGLDH